MKYQKNTQKQCNMLMLCYFNEYFASVFRNLY